MRYGPESRVQSPESRVCLNKVNPAVVVTYDITEQSEKQKRLLPLLFCIFCCFIFFKIIYSLKNRSRRSYDACMYGCASCKLIINLIDHGPVSRETDGRKIQESPASTLGNSNFYVVYGDFSSFLGFYLFTIFT